MSVMIKYRAKILPDLMDSPQQHALPSIIAEHGGDIAAAAEMFGIAKDQWLDLSTGVNPMAYPVAELSQSSFTQLPYLSEGLMQAATSYYGHRPQAAVSGTQVAIQALPQVLNQLTKVNTGADFSVLMPDIGYSEHRKYWRAAGNRIEFYSSMERPVRRQDVGQIRPNNKNGIHASPLLAVTDIDAAIQQNPQRHLVLIQPNNPTGLLIEPAQILAWSEQLTAGGHIIIDEAFIDTVLGTSMLLEPILPPNVIVLRSFGKFFGLAGLRLGFVFASSDTQLDIEGQLGIWQINGPAQELAERALLDTAWQQRAYQQIENQQQLTKQLFMPLIQRFEQVCQNPLFLTILMPNAVARSLYLSFAKAGILLRVIDLAGENVLVRIGNISLDQVKHIDRVQLQLRQWLQQVGCESSNHGLDKS